jgi:type IV secretory pathway TrbL component
MIKFIKNLLGFGSAESYKPQETVKEILTPPVVTASQPADNVTLQATYIPSAKPVNKVRAVGETGAEAVKAAVAPKPANKKRHPYRGNKNAGGTVAKVNQPKPQVAKPTAPKPAQVAKAKPAKKK